MEQIAATVQAASTQPTLRQMLGMNTQAPSGDPFAMIFQQMMAGGEEDGNTLAAMLLQLTDGLQKDAEDMGAKLAAELLYTMPGLQPDTLMAMLQNPGFTLQQTVQALQDLQPVPEATPQLSPALQLLQPQAEEAGQRTEEEPIPFTVLANPVPKTERAAGTEQELPNLDYAVMRAIRETLARNRKENTPETPDIESLQADVNAGRYLRTDTVAQAQPQQPEQVPSGEELAQQVRTGMALNAASGKSEFVVRLEPEGIGEIIVKLSEDKNRISLSILTTSTQTAKLINNEVAALQNALRPLQAEVQEVTVMSSEQAAQYSAQNQMTDQGRQFFHQQSMQQQSGRSHDFRGQTEDFEQTVQLDLAQDGLDVYV